MCIICNTKGAGGDFLNEYSNSLKAMKKATKYMLACKKSAVHDKSKKQYDKIHKKMVKLTKQWANIEHERELHMDYNLKKNS